MTRWPPGQAEIDQLLSASQLEQVRGGEYVLSDPRYFGGSKAA